MSAARWVPAAAIGAAVAAATTYGFKTATWYWPWNREALLNETAVALVAFGVPLAVAVAMRRWSFRRPLLATVVMLGGAFYLAGSFAGLALVGTEAPGFDRYRFYVFSGPNCEFGARFPRPPDATRHAEITGGIGGLDVAMLVDVSQVTTMTAECVSGAEPSTARAALLAWAKEAGVVVTEIAEMPGAQPQVIRLRGHLAGSILGSGAGGHINRTAVESRVYSGEHSLLRLTVTRADGEPPGHEAESFLASGRHR